MSGGAHIAGRILPDIIVLGFKRGTPQPERQAAVSLVNGIVVGGRRRPEGDGLYLIRINTGGSIEPLFRALAQLNRLPQVSTATPEMIFESLTEASSAPMTLPDTARVPMTAPDSAPTALWDSITAPANILVEPPSIPLSVIRDLVYVRFQPGTTQIDRQAAIDLVHGRVVGGMAIGLDEQFYAVLIPYVLAPGDSTSGPILRAEAALRQLSTITDVLLGYMDKMKPNHVRPHDRPGYTPDAQPHSAHSVVPLIPPDFVPTALSDSLGTISGPPLSGGPFRKDMLTVSFHPGTSQAVRQAAIESVGGQVVGGRLDPDGTDGSYYIRIRGGTTAALLNAVVLLQRQPGVVIAYWLDEGVPDAQMFRRSIDGKGRPRVSKPRGFSLHVSAR